MNVRFRWKVDVGECLLNTESGHKAERYDRQLLTQSGHSYF
ncbi:MAG: hypothetical protein V3S58_01160 [Nitrosomonadaceae bacterium]